MRTPNCMRCMWWHLWCRCYFGRGTSYRAGWWSRWPQKGGSYRERYENRRWRPWTPLWVCTWRSTPTRLCRYRHPWSTSSPAMKASQLWSSIWSCSRRTSTERPILFEVGRCVACGRGRDPSPSPGWGTGRCCRIQYHTEASFGRSSSTPNPSMRSPSWREASIHHRSWAPTQFEPTGWRWVDDPVWSNGPLRTVWWESDAGRIWGVGSTRPWGWYLFRWGCWVRLWWPWIERSWWWSTPRSWPPCSYYPPWGWSSARSWWDQSEDSVSRTCNWRRARTRLSSNPAAPTLVGIVSPNSYSWIVWWSITHTISSTLHNVALSGRNLAWSM